MNNYDNALVEKKDEDKRIEQMRKHFAKELSSEELELFIAVCVKHDLDPFMKQIYPMKRKCKQKDGSYIEKLSIEVSIDGLRAIAERTGNYAPGREPTFVYNKDNYLVSSTAYIRKRTPDGTWHEVSASAYFSEFASDYGNFWKKMPHVMLSKCAEAQAIRKSFPMQTATLYTEDEMEQSGKAIKQIEQPAIEAAVVSSIPEDKALEPKLTIPQILELEKLLDGHEDFLNRILRHYKKEKLSEIEEKNFEVIKTGLINLRRSEGMEYENS